MILSRRAIAVVICLSMVMLAGCKKRTSSVIATLTPSDGTTGVSLTTNVTAQFSGGITLPSDWTQVLTMTVAGSTTNLCTAVNYSPTTNTASCTYGSLDANTKYTITVQNLADTSNVPLADTTSTFTTVSSANTSVSAVTVIFSPTHGTTGVAASAPVTATFSSDITAPSDWTQVMTLTAANSTTNLCSSVTYDSTTLTATCTHAALSANTMYAIGMQSLTDADGSELTVTPVSFTTIGSSAVSVTLKLGDGTSIADQTTGIPVLAQTPLVKAVFSSDIQEPSDSWINHFLIAKTAAPTTNICQLPLNYDAASKTATCTPSCGSNSYLCYGTQYKITVTGLKDSNDMTVPDTSITFTTVPLKFIHQGIHLQLQQP